MRVLVFSIRYTSRLRVTRAAGAGVMRREREGRVSLAFLLLIVTPRASPHFYCFPTATTFELFSFHQHHHHRHHISIVFPPPPPPPHSYCFPSTSTTTTTTTTTFLLFSLHQHHHCYISIVFPAPPPPPHFYCFPFTTTTTTATIFLLFSLVVEGKQ